MSMKNACNSSIMMLQGVAKFNRVCTNTIFNFRTSSNSTGSQLSSQGVKNKVLFPNYKSINESCRGYSTEDRTSSQFPNIMDFPVFIWPNLLKSIRNWILSNFIIAKYFDRQFSLQEFIVGSKKAVDVVSHYIAKGDLNSITGLVSPEAITEVKQHLYNFSLRQQSELAISQDDVFLCFPYEIGIIFDDKSGESPQKRFVEITMCYHVLSGLKELRENRDPPPLNLSAIPEFQKKMYIVNYRFFRDFTEGVEPNWIINGFNHLKPVNEMAGGKFKFKDLFAFRLEVLTA